MCLRAPMRLRAHSQTCWCKATNCELDVPDVCWSIIVLVHHSLSVSVYKILEYQCDCVHKYACLLVYLCTQECWFTAVQCVGRCINAPEMPRPPCSPQGPSPHTQTFSGREYKLKTKQQTDDEDSFVYDDMYVLVSKMGIQSMNPQNMFYTWSAVFWAYLQLLKQLWKWHFMTSMMVSVPLWIVN